MIAPASPAPNPGSSRLEQFGRDIVWACCFLLCTLILGFVAWMLATAAGRATPRPTEFHLLVNRVVGGAAMLAIFMTGGVSLFDRRWRKRAALILAVAAVAIGALTIAFVEQQG